MWSALRDLQQPWETFSGGVFPLTSGVQLLATPSGSGCACAQLYASEDFFDLLDGLGPYTEEELGDPYSVIGSRFASAKEWMARWVREAGQVLGEPAYLEGSPPCRVTWSLTHLNASLDINQEDKECAVEVRLILTPPNVRPPEWAS